MNAGDVVGGRFVLESLAGTGGMASVWRARTPAGSAVAVKIAHAGGRDHVRFAREARLLADLHHPAIVGYVDDGSTEDGCPFLVMEWLEGEDLAARLTRGAIDVAEALGLIERVTEALAAAHAIGVVHRDIKPGNIFLPGGDLARAKLLDFGVAHLPGASVVLTRTGAAVGTPAYMAPEQARGESRADARVDLFALGCVLFECLAGRPAFVGDHAIAVLAKLLLEDVPLLRSVRRDVPEAVEALCERMTAKSADARPADARALLRELSQLEATVPRAPARTAPTGPPSLTPRERQLVTVVITSAADPDRAATVVADEPEDVALRALAAAHGGALELLAGGGTITVFRGGGVASDLAARAVRFALAARSRSPEIAVAVATGRTESGADLPLGVVIENAARLLAPSPARNAVALDPITSGLLPARFELSTDDAATWAVSERPLAGEGRLLLGKPAPWVGREREIAVLDALVADCVTEPRAVVALVLGEPGQGKSRLAHELTRRLRSSSQPPLVWMGRGDSMRGGAPYGVLADMLRRVFDVNESDTPELGRTRVRAAVAAAVPPADVQRVSMFLGELLGVPHVEPDVQLEAALFDPTLMGDQVRRAFLDLLRGWCSHGPLLLVLDDAHWADPRTLQLVDAAARELADSPLMVLALARPVIRAAHPGLWNSSAVHVIVMGGLGRRASRALVREVLGPGANDVTIADLAERGGGNPFFLEELLRARAEGSALEGGQTAVAIVQARLEAMETEARSVLRAASVFGETFWSGALRALLGGAAADELDGWLATLVTREVLIRRAESRFPGEAEHAFRHALVRDAAYAMLTEADALLGHRLAGGWLSGVGEDPATLAEHFEAGGEVDQARACWGRAAREALASNDFDGAVRNAGRAIALGASGEELGALRCVQIEADGWRGRPLDATAAREALELVTRGSPSWCAAAVEICIDFWRNGDGSRLEALGHQLLDELGGRVTTAPGLVGPLLRLAILGELAVVPELSARALALVDRAGPMSPVNRGRLHRLHGTRAGRAGDAERSLSSARAAERCFLEAGDVRSAAVEATYILPALHNLGAFEEIERLAEEGRRQCEALGLDALAACLRYYHGRALVQLGQLERASEELHRALRIFCEIDERRMAAGCRLGLAMVLQRSGDLDAAAAEAENAASAMAELDGRESAEGLAVLADVRLAQGQLDAACTRAQAALECFAHARGDADVETLSRLVLAKARLASGDRAAAHTHIDEARRRLLTRAAALEDPAWRRSLLENVPVNAETLALAAELLGT